MNRASLQEALALARSEMEAAESALQDALNWIEAAPRADKVAISGSLEQALDRLRSARSQLLLLGGLLADSSAATE